MTERSSEALAAALDIEDTGCVNCGHNSTRLEELLVEAAAAIRRLQVQLTEPCPNCEMTERLEDENAGLRTRAITAESALSTLQAAHERTVAALTELRMLHPMTGEAALQATPPEKNPADSLGLRHDPVGPTSGRLLSQRSVKTPSEEPRK